MKLKTLVALILAMVIAIASPFSAVFAEPTEGEATTGVVEETAEKKIENADSLLEEFSQLPVDNKTIPEAFKEVAKNEKITLYAITDTQDPHCGEFILQNNENGFLWRSNPYYSEQDKIAKSSGDIFYSISSQLVVTYTREYIAKNLHSQKSSVLAKNVKSEILPDGVKFVFTFTGFANEGVDDRKKDFVLPVKYSLVDDHLKAELLLQDPEAVLTFTNRELARINFGRLDTKIETDVDYNVTEIDFLPFLGAGGANEEGYMLIPDSSGAIINFNNGKFNFKPYSAPVYGSYRDTKTDYSRLSDNVKMPIFGIAKVENGEKNALFAYASENEGTALINAYVSGYETSFNNVYMSLLNKIIEQNMSESHAQPASPPLLSKTENFVVNYYPLAGENADYSGMAQVYKKVLVNEQGMKKKDDAKKDSLYLDMYAGVEYKKSIFGIPMDVFVPLTTYSQLRDTVDDLNSAGISDIAIKYNDWTSNWDKGKVKSKVSFESGLGGQGEFNKTVKFMEEKNVRFYPNVDFMNYSRGGNGYSGFFDCAKRPDQAPAFQEQKPFEHINLGYRWYLLKPHLVLDASQKFLNEYEKTGTADISIESVGNSIYSDSSKDGISRGDTVKVWEDIIKKYDESNGKVMVTNPNAYAIPLADEIIDAPSVDSYAALADDSVPFYQMAIRGYVPYGSESVNLSSNSRVTILRAAESGSALTYSLVANDTTILKKTFLNYLYSCEYSTWKDSIVKDYKEFESVHKATAGKEMIRHEKLDEGVYCTTYEGDVKVYVNYNEKPVSAGGMVINGLGYKLGRGQN